MKGNIVVYIDLYLRLYIEVLIYITESWLRMKNKITIILVTKLYISWNMYSKENLHNKRESPVLKVIIF